MRTHTNNFKNAIKTFGRELDSKITYEENGDTIELGNEELNSIALRYQGGILKSVMKQLDIDSNVEIPTGTILNYKFGVKTRTGKNIFDKNKSAVYSSGASVSAINTGVKVTATQNGTYKYVAIVLGEDELLGKTLTLHSAITESASNQGNIGIWFGTTSTPATSMISGNLTSSGSLTFTVASSFPAGTNKIFILLYANSSGTGVTDDYVSYTDLQVEESSSYTNYEDYGMYDYIDYGNFVVKDVEKQEDTRSYKITCYDKMLYAMKEYENTGIRYPITISDYLTEICSKIGLTYAGGQFVNSSKTINNELYLDSEARSLGYTFRDVLDEIAEVSASTICINDNDELEIRYLSDSWGGVNYLHNVAKGKTENNVTFIVNNDKTVEISSTGASANTFLRLEENIVLAPGHYYLKGGYASNTTYLAMQIKHSDNTYLFVSVSNTGSKAFDIIEGDVIDFVQVRVGSGYSGTYKFYPMITTSNDVNYQEYIDTIDEEMIKDVNVNFGEKFGPVNTIVLSRGGDGDKISLSNPTNLPDEDKIAIQITDNQIMNNNDRDTYMSAILTQLYGLEYYINDYSSTGICYLDLCDRYKVKIDNVSYNCIMFNDEINVTQGLQEQIYTDMQEENEQEYKYMSSTDRGITQANIIAKKNEATITEYTQQINDANDRIDAVEVRQTATERNIDIISTNIITEGDNAGTITEVTTTTGFTFNKDGLTISDNLTNFKAEHRNDGTYYKDGDTVVGQYTKDGSKQKDLSLFGVYYYGMEDKDDTPMFVAELYHDDNDEECFGHFYNGGDY